MNSKQPQSDAEGPARIGLVLAGGAASRMDGNKTGAELGGRPLISYPLAALAAAGLDPVVVAKADTKLPGVSAPVLREPAAPRHPLCGIVAALAELGEPVVALACDMPFAQPDLLAHLAGLPDQLAVPAPGDEPQPLCARYGTGILERLRHLLEREVSMRAAISALEPRLLGTTELSRFGDPGLMFRNVNDASELARAAEDLRP